MRARRVLRAALAALVALATARAARANPLDPFGLGSRETAMGGAAAADARDFSANYYNPAGLALARRMELTLGYVRVDHFLYTNGQNSNVDPVKGLTAGLVAPGTLLDIPIAFGLGLFLPDANLDRVRALPQSQPRWELYDNRNQRMFLATNVAVSPLPWLQIGGGLSYMAATTGTIDISGQADIFSTTDSQLRHSITADTTTVFYPQAGIRIAPSDALAFGLVYRGQFKLTLDLQATLHGDVSGLTTAFYQLQTDSVNNFLPQQVALGGSWKISKRVVANADVTWVNWSAYIPPVADINVKLSIPPPSGGWPPGITPPSVPAPTVIQALAMSDTFVPHVGVEWRAIDGEQWQAFVRGGYEFDRSPVGAQTGVTNYIDRDRHAFSLGLGAKVVDLLPELPREIRLDVHGQLGVLPAQTTLKTNPADFVGDYKAGGHIWNVGATLTMGF